MKEKEENIFKVALQGQILLKLTKGERQRAVLKLLENRSEQELANEISIPKSTIHDWKTLRQDNTGEGMHVSLSLIYRRLVNLEPKDIQNWGRLGQIKGRCEELLREKEFKQEDK